MARGSLVAHGGAGTVRLSRRRVRPRDAHGDPPRARVAMRRAAGLLCVFAIVAACGSSGETSTTSEVRADVARAAAVTSAADPTAQALNSFAVDLYRAARGSGIGN